MIDRLNGPRTRRMPCSRSHCSAVPKQRGEGLRAVLGVQHPEESGGVGVALEVQRVDLRADPPDRLAAAPGDPRLPSGVLEVRIAPGDKMQAPLEDERLDPGRVGFENPARARG